MTRPAVALEQYLDATNSHDFDQVARVLAPEPVYFFGDATCIGRAAVRDYFERTWALIPDERYWAEDIEWVVDGSDAAVAIYTYRWSGTVQGAPASGSGRATNAFAKTDDGWRLVHEHLSALATRAADAGAESGSGGV
ncbi:YybH family protein [Microbacterium sp. NPDC087591]|uniref:YybH family protein n=1 Tax=Microbacterium sp. NPDC087591 TaxID=3364192 RepID=UPI003803EA70